MNRKIIVVFLIQLFYSHHASNLLCMGIFLCPLHISYATLQLSLNCQIFYSTTLNYNIRKTITEVQTLLHVMLSAHNLQLEECTHDQAP